MEVEDRANALSVLLIAGAVVFVIGFTINAGFSFALAAGGIGLIGVAAGLVILQTAPLPNWLGWVALVIGLASFKSLFGIALVVLSLWTLTASIVLSHPS